MNLTRNRIGLGAGFRVANLGALRNKITGSLGSGLAQNRGGLGIAKLVKPAGISCLAGPKDCDRYSRMRPIEAAGKLASLDTSEARDILSKTRMVAAVAILDEMEINNAAAILADMETVDGANILKRMDPIQKVPLILSEMKHQDAGRLLSEFEPILAEKIAVEGNVFGDEFEYYKWVTSLKDSKVFEILKIKEDKDIGAILEGGGIQGRDFIECSANAMHVMADYYKRESISDDEMQKIIESMLSPRYKSILKRFGQEREQKIRLHMIHSATENSFSDNTSIIENIVDSFFYDVMGEMETEKAAMILGKMDADKAIYELNLFFSGVDVRMRHGIELLSCVGRETELFGRFFSVVLEKILSNTKLLDDNSQILYELVLSKMDAKELSKMDIPILGKILPMMDLLKALLILGKMDFITVCKVLNDENLSDEKVMEILSRSNRQAELFNELNADRMVRISQMGFVPKGR